MTTPPNEPPAGYSPYGNGYQGAAPPPGSYPGSYAGGPYAGGPYGYPGGPYGAGAGPYSGGPYAGGPYGYPGYGAGPFGFPSPPIPTPSNLTMGQAVRRVFHHYANFNGRASRSEFWWFYLFNAIIAWGLMIIFFALIFARSGMILPFGPLLLLLMFAYWIAVLVPTLAVMVRRFHDTGRSGAYILVTFIPFVGGIVLIVLLAQASQPANNQYGLAPMPVR